MNVNDLKIVDEVWTKWRPVTSKATRIESVAVERATAPAPHKLPPQQQRIEPLVRFGTTNLSEAVPSQIEDARLKRNMTIDDLAAQTEIPAAVLTSYELGERFPSPADLNLLNTHLHITLL